MISRAEYRGDTEPEVENPIVMPGSIDALSLSHGTQYCNTNAAAVSWLDVGTTYLPPIPS